MPIFKFTSPEGNEYYGEGADAHSAFQASSEMNPFEKAAARTRQSVQPSGGRGESGATDTLENMLVPGLGAVKAAAGGDYPGAAKEAALSAIPFGLGRVSPAVRALAAGGTATMSPTATAGGMFDAEPDKKKRAAWQRQYDEAGSKGKREVLSAFNAEQSKIQESNLRQQEGERAEQAKIREAERQHREAEEAELSATNKRRDWFAENADTIAALKKTDQDAIKGAGSLPEAQSLFDAAMERRRQAGMTLAERYPAGVLGLEAAAAAGDIAIPYRGVVKRTGALRSAADDAEKAYLKAYGPGSRASKATDAEAQLRRSILSEREADKTLTERMGLPPVSLGEAALGTTIPYFAGNVPNGIDILLGSYETDPAARERVDKAWSNALDPQQFLRSIAMGVGSTAIGAFAGSGRAGDIGLERTRARGILNQFEGREAAAAEKAAAAAARKKELADAKAAAAGARTSSREAAAAERERIAAGDIAKSQFAATAPKPLTPLQEAAEAQEAAKAAAAAQRKAVRALKAGGGKGAAGALAPGAKGTAD